MGLKIESSREGEIVIDEARGLIEVEIGGLAPTDDQINSGAIESVKG